MGVAAAFALTFAGGSVWLDEAFSVQVAESPWERFWELLRNDNGPPLYYALLRGWIALFGDGERALRLLSAVVGVAAVVPAIALGREVGGSRASGLAAGVLFAC
ncbi:MAG TPA: glycosyltransferase family 39 protein, partial [Myxococcaceae bacterium]|nr:glycosyltransferase family 39 protein [Myxococcaceae bacterium]